MSDLVVDGTPIDPSIKVIVLVRDPRATLHSLHSKSTNFFPPLAQIPGRVCGHILDNVLLADQVNIHVVRYEDTVLDPKQTLKNVQAYLGTPEAIELSLKASQKRVVNPEDKDKFNTDGFRSVYKPSDFNPNYWREDEHFKETYLDRIHEEPKCLQVLALMGYEL